MRELAFVFVALPLVACSGEADIGVSSQPVTCLPQSAAEVHGGISDPHSTNHFAFDAGTPRASNANQLTQVTLTNGTNDLILRFSFHCGPTEIAMYDVTGAVDQPGACPHEVAGVMTGQLQDIPASSGVVIVDENSNCLAARFHVDFGQAGDVQGWFSAPWQ
jgi:hypothetical protein